jgi:hypothetical protein
MEARSTYKKHVMRNETKFSPAIFQLQQVQIESYCCYSV